MKKNDMKDWIIKIVLILVIIILLIHNCNLIRKNNKQTPTGNLNIIEITCDKDDNCEIEPVDDKDNKDNSQKNNTAKKDNNSIPVNGEDNNTSEPEDEIHDLIVQDKKLTWSGETQAKIFTNSMYELKDIIAPETSNTYQFIVKNGTDYKLKYKASFVETNPYNINMKYKLKKNDTYIIDQYVSASELNFENVLLNSKQNDTYYLEWKWISSDNDTEIGKTPDANYSLKIMVEAESTDE